MTSATPQLCPHCQQSFQPTRRNQRYCSSQCRIDANNNQAQKKYTVYRQQTTNAEEAQQQLAELNKFVRQQILIAQHVEEVTLKTIEWNGRSYYRQEVATLDLMEYGIFLQAGGGVYVVAIDELIYRRVCDQKAKEPFMYKRID